ncbi:sialidase family protein [Kitasatospora aureofaciens]|uniref:sialidase family protein n=1 Tax=Kitasatospora aureofaciens TaxID=1894 RepID=UPI0037C8A6F5
MSTSHDGGATWSAPVSPSGTDSGLGGQPPVQPNGTVVVPFSTNGSSIRSFTSTNGGATWSSAQTVAGPMSLSQIASTTQGSMVADYLSTSVVNGKAVAIFAVGKAPTNGQAFDEGIYSIAGGLTLRAGTSPASTGPVLYTAPDRERTLPAAVRR